MPKAQVPLPQCWKVVGGADKGGILVREGQDPKSPEAPSRLATGALVKELQLVGDRLQYQKLRKKDVGPDTGWVLTKLPGKELLVKSEGPPEPDFASMVPWQVEFKEEPDQQDLDGWKRPWDFERIANFRDVADSNDGEPILGVDGKRLKKSMLFRSGHWVCATKRDRERLKDEVGIMTYIDLREGLDFEGIDAPIFDDYPPSPHKRHKDVPTPKDGVRRRLWCPFTKNLRLRAATPDEQARTVSELDRRAHTSWFFRWYNMEVMNGRLQVSIAQQLSIVNMAILFMNYDEVLKAMKSLTDPSNFPLLFGCVAGKDRTGIMSCLILGALGVNEDMIMKDYLKTNEASAHINACAQVGQFLYYKELHAETPHKWQMLLKAGRFELGEYAPAPDGAEEPFLRGHKAYLKAFGYEKLGMEAPPEDEEPANAEAGGEAAAPVDEPGTNAASSQENIQGAKVYRGTMAFTLELLNEQGGILAYLESIGFGPEDVAKLRANLLEDA